jgi:hypothetical protein
LQGDNQGRLSGGSNWIGDQQQAKETTAEEKNRRRPKSWARRQTRKGIGNEEKLKQNAIWKNAITYRDEKKGRN